MAEKKEKEDVVVAEKVETTEVAAKQKFDPSKLAALDKYGAANGTIKGLENVDKSDLKIAVYQLLQSNSEMVQKKEAEEGTFFNTQTKRAEVAIDGILLHMTKTRVLWKKPFKRGEKSLCRSFDGKKGVGQPGGNCATCPKKDWNGNTPPECRQGYNWLGLDLNNNLKPFRYTAISSGVAPTKDFITELASYGRSPFCFRVKITAVKTQNESGFFNIPMYEIYDVNSPEMVEKADAMLDSYKAMFEEDVALDSEHGITEDPEIPYVEEDVPGDEPF